MGFVITAADGLFFNNCYVGAVVSSCVFYSPSANTMVATTFWTNCYFDEVHNDAGTLGTAVIFMGQQLVRKIFQSSVYGL